MQHVSFAIILPTFHFRQALCSIYSETLTIISECTKKSTLELVWRLTGSGDGGADDPGCGDGRV